MNDSDLLVRMITTRKLKPTNTQEALDAIPTTRERIVDWLTEARNSGDTLKFHTLANFAVYLNPPGMAEVLIPIIENREEGYLLEDIVEILGELESAKAVAPVALLLNSRAQGDEIDQSLCLKCINALAIIDTNEARATLEGIALGDNPNLLRWHAALALEIEEELGFDEDLMTGPVHRRET
ncbi:HEAT repeat domain-containing protein [Streptomyces sp. P38-E01]|uniref:HEAT repeat domain-containing protein n=1 Tax=Streptomyces tardus TaxID=2780544 RepID=A0A949NB00_9ACTN|nr:HEAT repeat domain-containing protein [Streptomyces tardus]MBU7600363.1 HEAT repeat domain-containing protein [Streptomyces tardus]